MLNRMLMVGAIALTLAFGATTAQAQCVVTEDGSGVQCTTLNVGEVIVGTVCTYVDGENLVVEYSTIDGWEIVETNAGVYKTTVDFPLNNGGNLPPGQLPYNETHDPAVTSYVQEVPLSTLSFYCDESEDGVWSDPTIYYVVAHAQIRELDDEETEGVWGFGTEIVKEAMYFTITLTCNCDEDAGDELQTVCETAFAAGDNCFSEFGISRWGWSVGPLTEEDEFQTFPIYAAAGQCDTSKGVHVGTLHVLYSGGFVDVYYSLIPGFMLNETHLYVGNDPLPTKTTQKGKNVVTEVTVAPGQFPYKNIYPGSEKSVDLTLDEITGPIYIVAHAVVCWQE